METFGVGVFIALILLFLYEIYAIKTDNNWPTITEVVKKITKELRAALVVGSVVALLAWSLFHFSIV